jgi:hypothetical protein
LLLSDLNWQGRYFPEVRTRELDIVSVIKLLALAV